MTKPNIGLDYGVEEELWRYRETVLRRLVSAVMLPEKPAILHLRGSGRDEADASSI